MPLIAAFERKPADGEAADLNESTFERSTLKHLILQVLMLNPDFHGQLLTMPFVPCTITTTLGITQERDCSSGGWDAALSPHVNPGPESG